MRIRNFENKDAKKTSELIQRNILKLTTSMIYPKWVIETMKRRYSANNLTRLSKKRDFYLSTKDEEIYGVVSLQNNEIKTLYIDVDHQNLGIGSTLLAYVEGIAKEKGYNLIEAHSIPSAYRFYTKKSYHKSKDKYERNTLTAIIMKKDLRK